MAKYYPQAPTDWTTSLEKIYAKQSEQLQRHHDQLRERDQQMVKKAENESLANTFSALAQFSTTLGTAVKATQPARDKKNKKKRDAALVKLASDPNKDFIIEGARLKYAADKGDALSQEMLDKLITKLKERGNLEAAKAIEKVGPRSTIHDREAMSLDILPKLTEDNFLKELTTNRDFEKLDIYNSSSDPNVKAILLNSWREESLDFLELNDNFKIAILGEEITRQSESRNSANKNSKNYNISTADQAEVAAQIELRAHNPELLNSYLTELRDKYKTDIPGPIIDEDGKTVTVNQQITEKIFQDLYAASLDYKINLNTLTSYLKWGFPHGAGKDGVGTPEDVFFSKEQVNQLVTAATTGATRYENIVRTEDQAIYDKAYLLSLKGNKEEADELMRPLIGRDLLTQEQYADYERINPVEQSKSYEVTRDEHYTDLESKGKLPSIEELNQEPNKAMKDKWVQIKKDKEKWKSDNKHSYNTDLFKNEVYKLRTTRSLEPGQPITQEDGAVVQKLIDFSEMRLAYYLGEDRKNGTTTPNIAALIKQDVDTFKVGNGWGTQEGGMFSLDKSDTGDHKWANINKVDIDLGSQGQYSHNRPSPNREQSYNVRLLDYRGISKKDRQKLPETIFSNRQMLGFKENGYFSDDMKYIARREGLTLNEAYYLSLNSMDSKFAKLHNFKKLPTEAKANLKAHSFIQNGLEQAWNTEDPKIQKSAIRTLKHKLKYQGWDSFTPKDQAKLIGILTILDPITKDIEEEAETDETRITTPSNTNERRSRTLNATE